MSSKAATVVREWPSLIAGSPWSGGQLCDVVHPGDGSVVGRVHVPDEDATEQALAAAWAVRGIGRAMSAADRAECLMHVSHGLARRVDEVAALITAENGKPITWARAEATRAASTFRWAAEEARRFNGEFQRLDTEKATERRAAIIRRFPYGPVLGISPFNFPINLVAHKVAPAIAVGAPIVIKPAPATPLGALLLGELLAETDLPSGMFSVLPVGNDVAPTLVADPRLPVISFTGSESVGFAIKREVPNKLVILELGGNAAAIVLDDYSSDADIAWAAQRIAMYGNSQAGQTCVSVQRVFVEQALADRFIPALTTAVAELPSGDVWDPATVVGPVINDAAAERVMSWIDEAIEAGATVLAGGGRERTFIEPTLLADVPSHVKLSCEEVFGPVMSVQAIRDFDEGIALVNDSRFGLQTGVFTHDIQKIFRAHRELDVGGVIIGDAPTFRADQMPYGGIKASGVGREGLRFAMQDLTYDKVLVLTDLDL
ncbi:MAG: aldehyde dehydrogenase family protein [Actinobacteria bacterium]|nr:aldehyde dehydrogenase family protein [Actinomycetota bacterium]